MHIDLVFHTGSGLVDGLMRLGDVLINSLGIPLGSSTLGKPKSKPRPDGVVLEGPPVVKLVN